MTPLKENWQVWKCIHGRLQTVYTGMITRVVSGTNDGEAFEINQLKNIK